MQQETDRTKQSLCRQGRRLLCALMMEEDLGDVDFTVEIDKIRMKMLLNQIPRNLVNFTMERLRRSLDYAVVTLILNGTFDRTRRAMLRDQLESQRGIRQMIEILRG